jgi:hypothetical protein
VHEFFVTQKALLLLLLLLCFYHVTLGPLCTWYRPTTLDQLLTLKSAHNDLKLLGGNSEVRMGNACRIYACLCVHCCCVLA